MAHNPVMARFYLEASPSKAPAIKHALENHPPFKNARVRVSYEHEPPSPRRRTVDGVVQLQTNLTLNTITNMLPAGTNVSFIPPYEPPKGESWDPHTLFSFVRRGNQPISEFTTYGATGPLHDPTKGKLSSNDQQPRQGKRTDLDDMRDLARSGMTWKEMADQCPTVGKKHIMEHRARYLMTQSRDSCEVIVRFGPTGTSKTYQAINSDWSGVPYYSKTCSKENKWFCDYDGERKVILDEFRGEKHKMELSTVNQWLQDHNICRVEPKFGGCALIADKFVLTSPSHPTKWFLENLDDPDDNIDQLLRRITVIYEHTKAHPPLGSVFTTVQFKNETVHIIETRRAPADTDARWCARVRAMPGAA